MIYILEGPDGVGKTTLAREIQDKTKGHILHCTWKKDWRMQSYFIDILRAAKELNKKQDVVIDRWAPSEHVYGVVFRGGAQFNIMDFLWDREDDLKDIKWIICENDNVVENHKRLLKERNEMFDDMTKIAEEFKDFVRMTPELGWIHYDFDKVDRKEFVNELIID